MDVKKVIKEHGWTLERLASEMTNKRGGKQGISQSSLSQLLNGTIRLIARDCGYNRNICF